MVLKRLWVDSRMGPGHNVKRTEFVFGATNFPLSRALSHHLCLCFLPSGAPCILYHLLLFPCSPWLHEFSRRRKIRFKWKHLTTGSTDRLGPRSMKGLGLYSAYKLTSWLAPVTWMLAENVASGSETKDWYPQQQLWPECQHLQGSLRLTSQGGAMKTRG